MIKVDSQKGKLKIHGNGETVLNDIYNILCWLAEDLDPIEKKVLNIVINDMAEKAFGKVEENEINKTTKRGRPRKEDTCTTK